MIYIIFAIILVGLGFFLFARLRGSKAIANFTEALTNEPDVSRKTTEELIDSANDAKQDLKERVLDNQKTQEDLEKDTQVILDYQEKKD